MAQRFDDQSVRRISRSTLWTEGQQRNRTNWPRYQTRRGIGARGVEGASGTYIAILVDDLEPIDLGHLPFPKMGSGPAEIFVPLEDGELSFIGMYQTFNPYPYTLPASCPAGDAVYTCAKTRDISEGTGTDVGDTGTGTGTGFDTETEFTIIGIDVLSLLLSLNGADDEKALVLLGGVDYEFLKWRGRRCNVIGEGTGT